MGGMFVVAHATTRKRTSTSAVYRCRERMASPIEWVHFNAMLAHEHSPQLDDSDCCCHVHRRVTAAWPPYIMARTRCECRAVGVWCQGQGVARSTVSRCSSFASFRAARVFL